MVLPLEDQKVGFQEGEVVGGVLVGPASKDLDSSLPELFPAQ